jgi:hypothetical protein
MLLLALFLSLPSGCSSTASSGKDNPVDAPGDAFAEEAGLQDTVPDSALDVPLELVPPDRLPVDTAPDLVPDTAPQDAALPDTAPQDAALPDAGADALPDTPSDSVADAGLDSAPDEVGLDICQPECTDKECGDDGCGGVCGTCTGAQEECVDGHCVCQPECADKECGDDGCQGSCGECPDDPCFAVCIAGACSHETTSPEACNGLDDDCDGEVDEAGSDGCTAYYHDGDGDGFGDMADSLCLCTDAAPDGYTTDATDCCDADASVHPGQTEWFTAASDPCGGSWDYNCVNGVEYQHGQTVGYCGGFLSCTGPVGWEGTAASCGQQKSWVTGCTLGFFTCDWDYTSKTQGCH